jgi:hypothetical protein
MSNCPECGGCENTGPMADFRECPACQPRPPGDLSHGDWDDEPCSHDHDESCEDFQGFSACNHSHCMNCGACDCPGYCDDYTVYNLRPFEETGGSVRREVASPDA